jgi:hypothetical protein
MLGQFLRRPESDCITGYLLSGTAKLSRNCHNASTPVHADANGAHRHHVFNCVPAVLGVMYLILVFVTGSSAWTIVLDTQPLNLNPSKFVRETKLLSKKMPSSVITGCLGAGKVWNAQVMTSSIIGAYFYCGLHENSACIWGICTDVLELHLQLFARTPHA